MLEISVSAAKADGDFISSPEKITKVAAGYNILAFVLFLLSDVLMISHLYLVELRLVYIRLLYDYILSISH